MTRKILGKCNQFDKNHTNWLKVSDTVQAVLEGVISEKSEILGAYD